ncbi:very short patch repair endonuclease [Sodalis sp. dw_96]|uniref:very short patch repair endonuclease n=1 Tax=Sodalis sp. dw_96 TaxID=2719794 RepID=UPI001BD390D0|nr:very short patch repair endonuclease [Sodalis sp. dw_96]
MDIFDKEKRHSIMHSVHSKNTSPELIIRRGLYRLGLRYRLHRKELPGCPDIVFFKYKTAIFVNGCFWHGHNCSRGKNSQTNKKFWAHKIAKNKIRDSNNIMDFMLMKWKILIVWECSIKGKGEFKINEVIVKCYNFILSNDTYSEIYNSS